MVVLNNLAPEACEVRLRGCGDVHDAVETFGDHDYRRLDGTLDGSLELHPHGYRWFRARTD